MRIIDCVQGSDEWLGARAGIPTASNFDMIVTSKGDRSKSLEKYLYALAGERLIGRSDEKYSNAIMQRGVELEAEARQLYEIITDQTVEQVGLCLSDGPIIYGASPDGLVGEDGLLEIKCPKLSTHVGYLLKGVVPIEYIPQVQGQMLVTGRKWCEFLSYYPGISPFIIRVERDDRFLMRLSAELQTLHIELEATVIKLNEIING